MEINANALQAHLDNGDGSGNCSGGTIGIPAGVASAFYKTIADGNWENASTWENGNIPPSQNINNKTMAILHQVVLHNKDLEFSAGAILWLAGGGLTINNGNLTIDNAIVLAVNSDLKLLDGGMLIKKATSDVTLHNCTVNISEDFVKNNGQLWMENVCMTVGEDFSHLAGAGKFLNTTLSLGDDFTNASISGLEMTHVKIKSGSFQNSLLSKISGDSLVVWVEDGPLINFGLWTLPIIQYCVDESATGLGGFLPMAEDCAGMADYFNTCGSLIVPVAVEEEIGPALDAVEIAKTGTLDPVLLELTGNDAVVDWLLLEIREPNTEEILQYATVVLQRDGDIVSEDGEDIINFPTLLEGDYIVTLRHRNHLPLMTDVPVYLSILNPPMIDFTDVSLFVRGGNVGGRIFNGMRMMWGGDFNEDNKVIYQGPSNDVFYLFSRILSDTNNLNFLANFIIEGYDLHDFNLDGKVIYQGPNNDRASLLYHTVLAHEGNSGFLANYIAKGFLP